MITKPASEMLGLCANHQQIPMMDLADFRIQTSASTTISEINA
jgi:hypothetical protein